MLGGGIVTILAILLVTLPPVFLDLGLTINLSVALLILLVAVFVRRPIDISVFPTVLLLVTLYRLALNIASTRLILLNGDRGTAAAGNVIQAFGEFVVGGNFVVGIVVFLLFVIINFVVVTKGAGRIAEVAARFTLDAMPGKQMAIDADLNAGMINETQAVQRRKQIQEEADFYGTMDGANKFVRGDAIAGFLITIVNILGGLAIGTMQNDMSFAEAAGTYTLLTVGDGLISAVPSLLIAIAAAVIVSRAGTDSDLSEDIRSQFWDSPIPLAVSSAVLGALALVPGLPTFSFGILSAGLALGAYQRSQAEKGAAGVPEEEVQEVAPERPADLLQPPDSLELQVGYGLIDLVDPNKNGELLDRIRTFRREFTTQMGFPVPLIHIRDNLRLGAEDYAILVRGVRTGHGSVLSDHLLAIAPPGGGPALPGIESKDPTFGLPAFWVKNDHKDQAQTSGYTVVDPASVIMTHLTELIRRHSSDLLGRQETQEMLDAVAQTLPKLVSEVVPEIIPLGGVQKVLQSLLRESVPVRDLPTILEAIGDYAPKTKDPELLTELVRERLAAQISAQLAPDGSMGVLVLSPDIEQMISSSIQRTEHGTLITLDAGSIAKIVGAIRESVSKVSVLNPDPTILCTPDLRPHVRKMVERFLPRCGVISANELAPNLQVESIGTVNLS
ncbi:MAG: flagellar biosynthesis protein FlhA [bacterium]|nr:flagellar biosynthesis protein FlhA [bacterium]